MCHAISAVKKDNHYLYLTANDVFNTKRGKELQEHTPAREDWIGHGACRWFYGKNDAPMSGGDDVEFTDLSSPKNFPKEIGKDIKAGKFNGLFVILDLLSKSAQKIYYAKRKLLNDDYYAKRKPLDDDYYAKRKLLDDDYYAKRKLLSDDYNAKRKPLDDE